MFFLFVSTTWIFKPSYIIGIIFKTVPSPSISEWLFWGAFSAPGPLQGHRVVIFLKPGVIGYVLTVDPPGGRGVSRHVKKIDVLKAELKKLTKSRRRRDFFKANGEGDKISDAPQARLKNNATT